MSAIAPCWRFLAPALSSAANQPAQSLPVLALTVASLIDGTYACLLLVIAPSPTCQGIPHPAAEGPSGPRMPILRYGRQWGPDLDRVRAALDHHTPNGDRAMRFMIIVKATKESEAGVMPEDSLIAEMGKYHEELAKAGVLLDGSGLQPSSKGWRIKYSGGKRTITDGPFAETKKLLAGYTLIRVKSREEALEWTKRFPNPAIHGKDGEIEVPSCSSWTTSSRRRRCSVSAISASAARSRKSEPPKRSTFHAPRGRAIPCGRGGGGSSPPPAPVCGRIHLGEALEGTRPTPSCALVLPRPRGSPSA